MKNNEVIYNKSTVDQVVKDFEQHRKNLRTGYIICGVGYILTLLLATQNIIAATVIFIIMNIIFQLTVKKREKQFKKDFARQNIIIGLSPDFESCEYEYKSDLTMEEVNTYHLIPTYKGFLSVHNAKVSYKDASITLSDITSPYNSQADGKSRVRILSGCIAVVDLPASTGLNIRCVDKGFFDFADRQIFFCDLGGLTAIDTYNFEFQQKFAVYAKEQQTVPSELINFINDLSNNTKGCIGLSIIEDKLTVFITRRFLGRIEPTLKDPVTDYMIRLHPMPEIKQIKKIIDFCIQKNNVSE